MNCAWVGVLLSWWAGGLVVSELVGGLVVW